MIIKIIILILFAFIVYNLGAGLFHMLRDKGARKKTVNALTWRIGLSVLAFIFLFIAYGMGWLQPHGVVP